MLMTVMIPLHKRAATSIDFKAEERNIIPAQEILSNDGARRGGIITGLRLLQNWRCGRGTRHFGGLNRYQN
jgi:hypothetical protein